MGIDNVPTRVAEYLARLLIDSYHKILNEILENGMPPQWKVARVIAIQKKKNNNRIENHRLISNLCGLEKLF